MKDEVIIIGRVGDYAAETCLRTWQYYVSIDYKMKKKIVGNLRNWIETLVDQEDMT